MNLYNKINNLKSSLNNEKSIIDIRNIQKEILLDEELFNSIKEKKYDRNNSLVRKYYHLENEVNYIILDINMNLRKIIGSDCNESNTR